MAYKKIDQLSKEEKDNRRISNRKKDLSRKREAIFQYGILIDNNTFKCLDCNSSLPIACAQLSHILNNGKEHRLAISQSAKYKEYSKQDHWTNSGSSAAGNTFLAALKKMNWPKDPLFPMKYICANCHYISADRDGGNVTSREMGVELNKLLCTKEPSIKIT